VEERQLASARVSAIGLGCVGMSAEYGTPADRSDAAALSTLNRAVELGVTLFDTADSYGPWRNEELVGRFLRSRSEPLVISTKAGLVPDATSGTYVPNGRPDHLRQACEGSLRRLGVDTIDVYSLHRVDPEVPLEESWGALAELQQAGMVRALGICEVDTAQLSAVHAIAPVSAVQSELSLWTRDALHDVLPWCAANHVGFVPFAPLGRGFLTGTLTTASFDGSDIRANNPRFSQAAMSANQRIVQGISKVATEGGHTPAQVAIAWVLARGDFVVPIPGTKHVTSVEENVAATHLTLTAAQLEALDALPAPVGSRY
jgi:aryl-alcohol dehydrogenase-like predicted oxidoreductase